MVSCVTRRESSSYKSWEAQLVVVLSGTGCVITNTSSGVPDYKCSIMGPIQIIKAPILLYPCRSLIVALLKEPFKGNLILIIKALTLGEAFAMSSRLGSPTQNQETGRKTLQAPA